jgi:phage gpG-like protein
MIRIELKEDEISAMLARVSRSLADTTDLMNDLGRVLVKTTKDRIEAGLTPVGTPFAPRSPATLDRYAALKKVYGKPLNVSLEMRQGIFHQYGNDYAEVGSNAIQAAVMQFGAPAGAFGASIGKDKLGRDHFHSIPWGDIPARPFLGISDEDRTNLAATISEWLEGIATGTD